MDPTTTLVTFLFQTDPSVQSVQLIGSWDNFSTCYTMERDIRRGRDQWRGCFSFKNIVHDDGARHDYKRNGGLKMGHTYYYYYEVDGSTETYDPTMPYTTACPYMPGQAVNTLNVPVERTLRHRSASMNSMHQENFMTMNPEAKFSNPKPVTPVPSDASNNHRTGSAPSIMHHCSSSRSLSPAPSWRRFFFRKLQNLEAQRERSLERDDSDDGDDLSFTSYDKVISLSTQVSYYSRTSTPTEGSRTRDISPESLRRFLCEDVPATRPNFTSAAQPTLAIPDIFDEETDDDDNFATSAVSENLPYITGLSPPPFQRSASSESMSLAATDLSSSTLRPANPLPQPRLEVRSNVSGKHANPTLPKIETQSIPRLSISAGASAIASPTSFSPEYEPMTFYDSNDEDDDILSSNDDDTLTFLSLRPACTFQQQAFEGYSLPQQAEEGKRMLNSQQTFASFNSPKLLPREDSGIPVNGSNLLGTHIDSGLDDFISELGWIVDVIGTTGGN